MNSRIFEIARTSIEPTSVDPKFCFTEQQLAVFVETILSDCVSIADGLSKLYHEQIGFDVGYSMGAARVGKEIKKHFGIEE